MENRRADPGLLELVGVVSDLLGLGEHIQRLVPLDRTRAQRRHKRIAKLRDGFRDHLESARTALRSLRTAVDVGLQPAGNKGEAVAPIRSGAPVVAFDMPISELPVFVHSLLGVQVAIQGMTKVAYELESATTTMPDETQKVLPDLRGR